MSSPPGEALRPEVAYALIEELKERKQAEMLAHLAQEHHRALAKASRTALHWLRSQKVEVEVPNEPTGGSGTGQAIQQEIPSLVTVYDGLWERLVCLGVEAPAGVRVFQARVSALHGMVDFITGTTSRRDYRSRVRAIRKELGGELIEAELAYWFIDDAAKRSEAKKKSLPPDYARASQAMGQAPRGQHPALALALPETEPSDLQALFDLPELQLWHPGGPFIRRMQLKLDELATSRLMINENQRTDQVAAIIDRALEEYFTKERRKGCRQFLLDAAHMLANQRRAERASEVRWAADVFKLSLPELKAHPLPRFFMERLLDTPRRAKAREHAPEQISEGGLILP
jgi:hypothetical protein